MTKYNGGMKWTHKAAFALVTIAIAATALEWVAGAMRFPDPDAMAVREQVLAAQSERAQQIRTLQQGELQIATTDAADTRF